LFSDAIITELTGLAGRLGDREVSSVFFGGGTPSLMQPRTVAAIVDHISGLWPVVSNCEISLEANPSSTEAARFAGYRLAGVNRISLGIQSLDDKALRWLGRMHSASEARNAIEIADAHFSRISLDLIYGIQGQTLEAWHKELSDAIAFSSGHISCYQLTIETGTRFAGLYRQGKIAVPGEDRAADFYQLTDGVCSGHGLHGYEVSNYAIAGEECQHNMTYWRYGEYAGVGPGSHSRLNMEGNFHALTNIRHPDKWRLQMEKLGHGYCEDYVLAKKQQFDEMLIMGMRLAEGVSVFDISQRTGIAACPGVVVELIRDGLLKNNTTRLVTTLKGRMLLGRVISRLAEGSQS
jgi:oxygen-independent coproporphyrinogen-3 oxidase